MDTFAANLNASYYNYYLQKVAGALNYSHAAAYWPALDALQFKSAGQVDGFNVFGYRVIDLRAGAAPGTPAAVP